MYNAPNDVSQLLEPGFLEKGDLLVLRGINGIEMLLARDPIGYFGQKWVVLCVEHGDGRIVIQVEDAYPIVGIIWTIEYCIPVRLHLAAKRIVVTNAMARTNDHKPPIAEVNVVYSEPVFSESLKLDKSVQRRLLEGKPPGLDN